MRSGRGAAGVCPSRGRAAAEKGFYIGGAVDDQNMRAVAAELALFLGERVGDGTEIVAALVREENEVEGAVQGTEVGVLADKGFRRHRVVVGFDLADEQREIAGDAEAPELAFRGRIRTGGGKGYCFQQLHRGGELRAGQRQGLGEVGRPVGDVGGTGGEDTVGRFKGFACRLADGEGERHGAVRAGRQVDGDFGDDKGVAEPAERREGRGERGFQPAAPRQQLRARGKLRRC